MAGYVRTNIEAEAWGDLRFAKLARYLQLGDALNALIRCARLWSWQTDNYTPDSPTYIVDADTIDAAIGIDNAAPALVRAGLAEETPEGFRIRGAVGRIEWLWKKRTARKRSDTHKDGSLDTSHDPSVDPPHDGAVDGQSSSSARSSSLSSLSSLDLNLGGDQRRSADHNTVPGDKPPGVVKPERDRASKIPERAWNAADFFRQLVLDEYPKSALRKKPWDGQKGLRLEWADSLRKLVECDGRTWEEAGEMLLWLFKKQPPGPHRYIVQSPDSLREKWDRIHANRSNRQAAIPAVVNGSGTRAGDLLERQLERVREAEEAERRSETDD